MHYVGETSAPADQLLCDLQCFCASTGNEALEEIQEVGEERSRELHDYYLREGQVSELDADPKVRG